MDLICEECEAGEGDLHDPRCTIGKAEAQDRADEEFIAYRTDERDR